MAIVTTRPFSPRPDEPFTGYFIYVNSGQERSVVEIEQGNPKLEPVELMPGRYSVEWVEAEKEPIFDTVTVPDEAEVELKDICNRLKGDQVDEEAVKAATGEPVPAVVPGEDVGSVSTDQTVGSQPPATEQEVAPDTVSTKRGGGKAPNA